MQGKLCRKVGICYFMLRKQCMGINCENADAPEIAEDDDNATATFELLKKFDVFGIIKFIYFLNCFYFLITTNISC